ncbi:MAG: GNAT family N-acetyltransferase [Saprospiraceae bacterium]
MQKSNETNKVQWADFCEKNYVPLYFRPWWMDCVCGPANWDVCLSLDKGGNVEGALVYHTSRYWGLPVIKMPPLTAYSGLWLNYPSDDQRPSSKMAFTKRVCENLIQQLPAFAFFYQQWHPEISNWLPFYWKGFRQTTLYTYQLPLQCCEEDMLQSMNKSSRKRIRKEAERLIVKTTTDVSTVFSLYESSLKNNHETPGFSLDLFKVLEKELASRHQGKILEASDKSGMIHAVQYLIWDEQTTYALLGGINTNCRKTSGALYLLFWDAISNNYGSSNLLDFEGSILEGVEESIRSFGGTLTPHFKITKAANRFVQTASLLFNKGI